MGRNCMQWLAALFLLGNLVVRLSVLHNNGLDVPAIVLAVALIVLFFRFKPDLLQGFCLLLGLTFPLYCYQPYTLNTQIFESLILVFGLMLCLFPLWRVHGRKLDRTILFLLSSCLLLAVLSMVLLPCSAIVRLFSLWSLIDFGSAVLASTPDSPLYPLAAANRLLLFFLVILLVSVREDAHTLYRNLFRGAAAGGLLASFLGILNQYDFADLSWLRPQFLDPSGVPRLHSVTGNPGWFAQYILGTFPFVLLLLPGKERTLARYFVLTVVSFLCGLALLLTASRTSWILFPLVTLFCVLYLIHSGRETVEMSRRTHASPVRGVMGVALVSLLVLSLISGVTNWKETGEGTGGPSRKQYILKRLRHIATPGERMRVWSESLVLAGESPVFGLGYEGYKWHQKVMMSIPASRFARNRKTANNWDTPHNFFLQLVIGNGLAGLALWVLLLSAVLRLLWLDYRRNGSPLAVSSFLSMLFLLMYGLTQAIQYVPMIWFLLFLSTGFAMTLGREPYGRCRSRPLLYSALIILLCIGAGVYLANIQSRRLAERYGVARYSEERGPVRYAGFYDRENWGKEGVFRWSGPRAEIRVPYSGMVSFDLVCNTPGLTTDPVVIDVALNTIPLDRYTFWNAQKVRRTYYFPTPESNDTNTIVFTISRTWTPRLAGVGLDTRNLGIAVSEPRLMDTLAFRETGFSGVEVDDKEGRLLLYRLTGRSGVLDPSRYGSGRLRLFLRGTQPFLQEEPLLVHFSQGRKDVGFVHLAGPGWNEVALPPDLHRDRPLRFLVSRTWNPRKDGYGDDGRDLGVALAPLPTAAVKRR